MPRLEKNIKDISNPSAQLEIISDLELLEKLVYIPFVRPKAKFRYTHYFLEVEGEWSNDFNKERSVIFVESLKKASDATAQISNHEIRIAKKDSIFQANYNLESNLKGHRKKDFCQKWSAINAYLYQKGFIKFNCQ